MFFVLLINFQISFSFVLIVLKPKCIYFLKDGTEVYFLTGLVILPEWLKSAGNLGRVKEAERPEIYKPRHGIGLGIWKGLETKSESSSFIYKHTSFWIQKFELLVYFFFSQKPPKKFWDIEYHMTLFDGGCILYFLTVWTPLRSFCQKLCIF